MWIKKSERNIMFNDMKSERVNHFRVCRIIKYKSNGDEPKINRYFIQMRHLLPII